MCRRSVLTAKMIVKRVITGALAVLVLTSLEAKVSGDIEIIESTHNARRYGPVFIRMRLPYFDGDVTDPGSVEVSLEMTSPTGRRKNIAAFCHDNDIRDGSLWEGRFTPTAEGEYSYVIVSRSAGGAEQRSAPQTLEAAPGTGDGFLRRSSRNDHYLEFDSGRHFFGIGHNVPWVENSCPDGFAEYFARMSEAGCNLSRVWMCDWSFPLEWGRLGEYNVEAAGKFDRMLEAAEEHGIYILLVLDTYGSLMKERGMWGEGRWAINPYNITRGGPCLGPEDFFTHEEALRRYRNRIRYIVSRWGYSPNILAFELWNEYNAPVDWTRDMAAYIRQIDAAGRAVTTSLGYPYDAVFDGSLVWELEEIDIVNFHEYGSPRQADRVSPILRRARSVRKNYSKPFLFSEVSIDPARCDAYHDPEGLGTALHNTIWAAFVSGSLGTAMNWWHDTYIARGDLYGHYSALAEFVRDADLSSGDVEPAELGPVRFEDISGRVKEARDVIIDPVDIWGVVRSTELEVFNSGETCGGGTPVKYLHGHTKKEMQTDHIYHVDYASPGEFVLRIGTVSQGARLHIHIDGEEVLEREFTAGSGEGPWKSSTYLEQYDVYQCVYDEDVAVEVGEGAHTIRIFNTGRDWIGIERITLTNYSRPSLANVRALGIRMGGTVYIWLQDRDSNWKNDSRGQGPSPVENVHFEVMGLGEGEYELEWWDTYQGTVVKRGHARSDGEIMNVRVPAFTRDIALKVSR